MHFINFHVLKIFDDALLDLFLTLMKNLIGRETIKNKPNHGSWRNEKIWLKYLIIYLIFT